MKYETALALKKAGFPQYGDGYCYLKEGEDIFKDTYDRSIDGNPELIVAYVPTLSELIEACGKLIKGTHGCITIHIYPHSKGKGWGEEPLSERQMVYATTNGWNTRGYGSTPEEAVASLYILLKETDNK